MGEELKWHGASNQVEACPPERVTGTSRSKESHAR